MVISYGVVYREAASEYVVTNPTYGDYKQQPEEAEENMSVQSLKLTFGDIASLSDDEQWAIENKGSEDVTAL